MLRILLTFGAYLASLATIAVVAFFVVVILAGPHAGLLPRPLEAVVLVAGWLAVLVAPVWIAIVVWRRTGQRRSTNVSERTHEG